MRRDARSEPAYHATPASRFTRLERAWASEAAGAAMVFNRQENFGQANDHFIPLPAIPLHPFILSIL
ncbi:MAG: hypothetical protein FJ276_33535 [Planctomycetes bacterium]|nr:hypothetical protein [Planctomycetota bacterium]